MPRLKGKYFYFAYRLAVIMLFARGRVVTMGASPALEPSSRVATDAQSHISFDRRVYVKAGSNIEALDGGVIAIGAHTFVNRFCSIVSRCRIDIGANCLIGDGVSIYDHNHNTTDTTQPYRLQGYTGRPIKIGNNVWIGAKVFIGAGVVIGDNAIVGAHTVITKDVPPDCIAHGHTELVVRPVRDRAGARAKRGFAAAVAPHR